MTDKQIISNGYNSLARDCSSELDTPLTSQIIIDGVDVSGCIYYKATGKYNTCGYDCELTHNCYYKQLKRKEQECEKAKKIIETAVDDFNLEYGTPQYDRLLKDVKALGIEVSDYE